LLNVALLRTPSKFSGSFKANWPNRPKKRYGFAVQKCLAEPNRSQNKKAPASPETNAFVSNKQP
jgi:hypothetical protein